MKINKVLTILSLGAVVLPTTLLSSCSNNQTQVNVSEIKVTTLPTKLEYKVGEKVDLTGLVITATMSDGTKKDVTKECSTSPAQGEAVTEDLKVILVNHNPSNKTATFDISIKQNEPIVDPTQEEKQHTCEEGSSTCKYSVEFKSESAIKPTSEISLQLTDITKSEENVDVSLVDTKATISGNTASFDVEIDYQSNNTVVGSAEFAVVFECIDDGQVSWTQKISGYKISKTFDTESHQISTESNINEVEIESDVEIANESTPINLTITNSRQENVTDASLTITAGSNHITVPLDTLEQSVPLEILYTKDTLQEMFAEKGFTIGDNDPITFSVLKVGSYKVENNQLYKNNELNEFTKLTDAELTALAGKFFYLNKYDELVLNPSELTFPKYIQSCIPSGNNQVYIIKGTYYSQGANPASGTADIYVHGILDNSGNKISEFRTWRDYAQTGEAYDYGLGQEGIKYHMDHLIMQGRHDQGAANYYLTDGMVCPYLSCEYCDFTGSYTASITQCHFKNCTFDTTNTWKGSDGSTKNNNAMFLYGGSEAEFDTCTFTSKGKAVKIYYGQMNDGKTYNFSLKNCQFNLANNYCNYIEYPLDIDAQYHTNGTTFNLTIENTTMNQLWKDKLQAIGAAYPNQLYHINDTQVTTTGQADHIIINGSRPLPFFYDPSTPLPTPTQE